MPKRNAPAAITADELRRRRWQVIRGLMGVAAVVLAAVIVWALLVPGTDWLAHHDIGSSKGSLAAARDAARGRLLALGVGLFAAGTLIFTGRSFTLSRRTFELTEQGQVTDRYTKAIDQLGSDKGLDVRIGGIYALERIAHDSAKDHPTVMEVLTAFIRDHSREPWPVDKDGVQHGEKKTRPDVQAAATVVGRRDVKRDIRAIDLTGADLVGADLRGATLRGTPRIPRSGRTEDLDIEPVGAILRDAILRGADLTRANLFAADLTGADLSGAHLTGAYLFTARLDGADLTDAGLIGATLRGATFRDANLTRARLFGETFTRADLIDLGFSAAAFTEAELADTRHAAAVAAGRLPSLIATADSTDAEIAATRQAEAAALPWRELRDLGLTDADLTNADFTRAGWDPAAPAPRGWTMDDFDPGRLMRAG
jgi:uncharacterized protein YjbI with pentapeptide repeats